MTVEQNIHDEKMYVFGNLNNQISQASLIYLWQHLENWKRPLLLPILLNLIQARFVYKKMLLLLSITEEPLEFRRVLTAISR